MDVMGLPEWVEERLGSVPIPIRFGHGDVARVRKVFYCCPDCGVMVATVSPRGRLELWATRTIKTEGDLMVGLSVDDEHRGNGDFCEYETWEPEWSARCACGGGLLAKDDESLPPGWVQITFESPAGEGDVTAYLPPAEAAFLFGMLDGGSRAVNAWAASKDKVAAKLRGLVNPDDSLELTDHIRPEVREALDEVLAAPGRREDDDLERMLRDLEEVK